MRTFIILFIAALSFVSCKQEQPESIIYLVRHAEKDTTDKGEDPVLTEEGMERALRLKGLLKEEKINVIYSTKYDRNLHTVKPIADYLSISPAIYEWSEWTEEVNTMKNNPGIYLLCGHGDNLLPMISALNGQPPMEKIGHYDYQNLFKLSVYKDTTLVEWVLF
jgi:broad specificity phosphatase PhoE